MRGKKAVFMDRDGVVNELRYVSEHGRVETPLTPGQFRLISGVARGIKALQASGFSVVIVSNQPGIAKGQFTPRMFDRIRQRMQRLLEEEGARVDGEYYCLHHPQALTRAYRASCDCRKPHPGLILQAAREGAFDLGASFMVGDGLVDVEAGSRAGCETILISHLSSLLTEAMTRKRIAPTYLAETFEEAVECVLERDRSRRNGTRPAAVTPATQRRSAVVTLR